MKKNKQEKTKAELKEERLKLKAYTSYLDVEVSIGLTDKMSAQEKLKIMIKAGVNEMTEMNEKLDSIISEDWEYISNTLDINISKAQYKEFVSIMTKIKLEKFSDKNREKYELDTKQKRWDQYARENFLNSVINSYEDKFSIPKDSDIEEPNNRIIDKEFNSILNKSIEKNIEINTVHKQLIDNLCLAFVYITDLKYTTHDFKNMLDWKYYNGGVPNESSHSKLFDLFYKFMIAARLGADFEIKEFSDMFEEIGMKLELIEPMPKSEHWSWWTPDVIQKYCPTVSEEYFEWLNEKQIK